MKTERLLEVILTALSCIVVANALAVSFLNAGNILPMEYYSTSTMLAVAWLLALVFMPKRLNL